MDQKYLSEIKAREQAATPGPWEVKTNRHPETTGEAWGWIKGPSENWCWTDRRNRSRHDAEFVAASRTDIPALIAEVERLTKENAELKKSEIDSAGIEQIEAAEKPMYDSLSDIIKALDAMYSSEKFIKKADYWSRCAGEAASILRRVASRELAEVKHAHWENGYFQDTVCSMCLHPSTTNEKTDYCPHCGALMDGRDDDDA